MEYYNISVYFLPLLYFPYIYTTIVTALATLSLLIKILLLFELLELLDYDENMIINIP